MFKQCNPTRIVLLQISTAKNLWQDGGQLASKRRGQTLIHMVQGILRHTLKLSLTLHPHLQTIVTD